MIKLRLLLIINGLKSSKASGPNSIPSSILVEFSNYLIEPLTTIINMSLKEGIFPSLNKEAYVCPIISKKVYFLVSIKKLMFVLLYQRRYISSSQ